MIQEIKEKANIQQNKKKNKELKIRRGLQREHDADEEGEWNDS